MEPLKLQVILVVFLPLIGALLAGLFGKQIGRQGAHFITVGLVGASSFIAIKILLAFINGNNQTLDSTLYEWGKSGGVSLQVGFLIDKLTAIMMVVVTFISFMVHIYTIGYMKGDPGYQRFFSYISLFTFAMLMLVTANNFLQLFFGWEAVGLVSYLLIGFWYKKSTAIFANLKAFLVNRVGDFGFLLGIAAILLYFGSLDYKVVFAGAGGLANSNAAIDILGNSWQLVDVIAICLFIGAMGKSAQVPLHVWLPDSMEGPTPISALIHAATMVTAGVFLVTRMSPIFEYSEVALNLVLVIGSITCFFMGLIGIVQNDIKRIVAYSTLSQLGYMMVAAGASAYSIAIFHLLTHAFFKALLFLGAGSVIIAMHHEQSIMKMGNLKKYMPITYITMLLGTLALIGFPGFSGFYSKDLIIEAVHNSNLAYADWAYVAVLLSVFVTSLYSFRLFFLVFHTKERMDEHTKHHLKESPVTVWLPLALLAIPSVIIGAYFAKDMLSGFFNQAVFVLPEHDVLSAIDSEYHGATSFALHGFQGKPFYLAMFGLLVAWLCYVKFSALPQKISKLLKPVNIALNNKYWFDSINENIIAPSARGFGWLCWRLGDIWFIDGLLVNGSANTIGRFAKLIRRIQTGYLYHYAFAMIAGFFVLLIWLALS